MLNVYVHIVDDDIDSGYFIEAILKSAGITNCKIFTEPDKFLKSSEEVHICILDYRFKNSGLTGLEITEELLKRNDKCRIIIVTVAPDFYLFMKVFNAGCWKYLSKNDDEFKPDLIKYVRLAIINVAKEIEEQQMVSDFKTRHKQTDVDKGDR